MKAETPLAESIERLSSQRTMPVIFSAIKQFQRLIIESTPHFQNKCHKFVFPMALYLAKQLLDVNQDHEFAQVLNKFRGEFSGPQQAILDQFIREGREFVMPAFDLSLDPISLDYLREKMRSMRSEILSMVFEMHLAPLIEPLDTSTDPSLETADNEYYDDTMRVDLPDIAHMTVYNHYDAVSDLKLSRGLDILSVAEGSKVTIHALNEGCAFPNETSACDILMHRMRVTRTQFSNNSCVICSGSIDGDIRLAHTEACKQVRSFSHHKMPITDLQFSENSGLLAATSLDHCVSLWAPNHPKILRLFYNPKQPIYCVSFSNDNRSLWAASSDGYIRLWEIGEGKRIAAFKTDVREVPICLRSNPVDGTIMCGWSDGTIAMYDASDRAKAPLVLHNVVENMTDIQFTSDGRKALVGSLNSTIAVLDLHDDSGVRPRLLEVNASTVDSICVARGDLIATVGRSMRGRR